jgi:DtxR family Mn-dependent transcriptional regulator
MASSTVENYLKHLYLEQQSLGEGALVPTGRLAEAVGVSPGTATAMIKALAESGDVHYEPRSGVRLSRRGQTAALHVLRRHRLVELFLVEILGLDWSEVHEEAEVLEHAISEKVIDRIDELLGHPTVDPHGDPIPQPDGTVSLPEVATLAECRTRVPLRVVRVLDQDPGFLQMVDRHGLAPGARIVVEQRDAVADSVSVAPEEGGLVPLGREAASKILVATA